MKRLFHLRIGMCFGIPDYSPPWTQNDLAGTSAKCSLIQLLSGPYSTNIAALPPATSVSHPKVADLWLVRVIYTLRSCYNLTHTTLSITYYTSRSLRRPGNGGSGCRETTSSNLHTWRPCRIVATAPLLGPVVSAFPCSSAASILRWASGCLAETSGKFYDSTKRCRNGIQGREGARKNR
jgi:hypothetical protein